MRKKKIGYFLLAALVVSGLAGMVGTDTLTKAERRFVVSNLKQTRADLLKSIKGLSETQLNYKVAPDKWSVKECVYHIAVSENQLWGWMETTLKAEANPEKRADIKVTDEQLISGVESREKKVKTQESLEPKNAPWKNTEEAIDAFKTARAKHITYLKTTTENLRAHITDSPLGPIDAYQLVLLMSAHTNRHMQQIEEVMADPGFPRQ